MTLYRIIVVLALPFVWLVSYAQVLTGRLEWTAFRNRRGTATTRTDRSVIWLHAASVGELKSVRLFLKYLVDRFPDHQLLVTVNNHQAIPMAEGWVDLPLTLQVAPVDSLKAVRRFLDHWKPVAFVNVESEIWPNRLGEIASRSIPTVFLNARLSEKSGAQWRRFGLSSEVFKGVGRFFCQDENSAANFERLGIPPDRVEVTENLKALVPKEDVSAELEEWTKVFPRSRTFLAASTHRGEDAKALEAFSRVLRIEPDARLILAPRHPQRGDEIAKLLSDRGFNFSRRSKERRPADGSNVFLADTMGEMALWYSLAAATFVGGSLVQKRGHTPYEPALYGTAIVTGPSYENFSRAYQELQAANACRVVKTGEELGDVFVSLLENDAAADLAGRAGKALSGTLEAETLFDRIAQVLGLRQVIS